jgi:uncharacterized protein
MALGVLHFTFLWHGDIIFVYGLFGLFLTLFFFRADKTIKIWSWITFSVSTFLLLLFGALVYIVEHVLNEDLGSTTESNLDEILRNGTFLDSIPARLEVWLLSFTTGIFIQGGLAFAAFLLGVRLARSNFLSSPMDKAANSRMIKTGLILGLPIQIIAAVILLRNEQSVEPSESIYLISLIASFLAAPLLSMFYLGVIRKLAEERAHLVSWMIPAGKMSLTVYISQSVLTSMIFGPWGLGLFQELSTWQVLLLALLIWLFLVYLSSLWLKKFKQGPLERVVNVLTKKR